LEPLEKGRVDWKMGYASVFQGRKGATAQTARRLPAIS
jgi:hypothetical protein